MGINYEGTVYRPPSEAHSLIVQITVGCAHNHCTFCTMYKNKQFRIRTKAEIFADFDEAAALYGPYIRRVFLADGDALIVKTADLLEILAYVYGRFPKLERVTAYGTAHDILHKSEEELKLLKAAGLDMIYMGAESGDPQVLRDINKGVSREQLIEAGQKLALCGMSCSVTLISGLGGHERLLEHAVASAGLISEMKPAYVGFLTLMVDRSALIYDRIASGDLTLLDPEGVLEEMRLFLSHVDSEGTVFRANHASNYIIMKGTLNADIPRMLSQLEAVARNHHFRAERFRRL